MFKPILPPPHNSLKSLPVKGFRAIAPFGFTQYFSAAFHATQAGFSHALAAPLAARPRLGFAQAAFTLPQAAFSQARGWHSTTAAASNPSQAACNTGRGWLFQSQAAFSPILFGTTKAINSINN